MRWRALLLSGLFAATLGLGFTTSASADPPPWAGRWKHNKHYDGDYSDHWRRGRDWRDGDHWWRDDHDWRRRDDASWRWRRHDDWRWNRDDSWWWRHDHDRWNRDNDWWRRDHDWWQRDSRYTPYRRYGGNYVGNGYSAACSERIARDRAKIAEIGPTGRHRKALRWFQDDLNNAMRDGC